MPRGIGASSTAAPGPPNAIVTSTQKANGAAMIHNNSATATPRLGRVLAACPRDELLGVTHSMIVHARGSADRCGTWLAAVSMHELHEPAFRGPGLRRAVASRRMHQGFAAVDHTAMRHPDRF